PHMLWYDWVLLLPAGLAVGLERYQTSKRANEQGEVRPRAYVVASPGTSIILGLLLLLHLAVNLSTLEMENLPLYGFAFFVSTPVALFVLAYLAFEVEIRSQLQTRTAAGGAA